MNPLSMTGSDSSHMCMHSDGGRTPSIRQSHTTNPTKQACLKGGGIIIPNQNKNAES